MLIMAVAQLSSDDSAVMMSRFHVMESVGQIKHKIMVGQVRQMAAPGWSCFTQWQACWLFYCEPDDTDNYSRLIFSRRIHLFQLNFC